MLSSALVALGYKVHAEWFLDENYNVFDNDDVADYVWEQTKEVTKILDPYVPDRSDCDDFAWLLKAFAIIGQKKGSSQDAGIAFGWVAYQQDSGVHHAINVAFTKIDNTTQLMVRFFEPQSGQELQLSNREKQNIHMIIV